MEDLTTSTNEPLDWEAGAIYGIGRLVRFNGDNYVITMDHRARAETPPGKDNELYRRFYGTP